MSVFFHGSTPVGQIRQMSRFEISKMLLCLVLPHSITTCDGKADCANVAQKISTFFKVQVHHYMSLVHAHSDIISYILLLEKNLGKPQMFDQVLILLPRHGVWAKFTVTK